MPNRARPTSLLVLFLLAAVAAPSPAHALPDDATLRAWIEGMKASPKGPFQRIRWFCEDGTVLPPKGSCREHGGGIQHGEWNDRTRQLRKGGYLVGNLLAELEPEHFTGADARQNDLEQILLERFLVAADDGWIFRGARTYRGAFQAEDEDEGAQQVLRAMLRDETWEHPSRFFLLRETVRLFPGTDGDATLEVRQAAVRIADRDRAFEPLRAKIHGVPDAGDAERVRAHARSRGKAELAAMYEKLAADIDALYGAQGAVQALEKLAGATKNGAVRGRITEARQQLAAATDPVGRLKAAANGSSALRKELERPHLGGDRMVMLRASLALEREAYAAGNLLTAALPTTTRRARLKLAEHAAVALYGAGLLSARHVEGVRASLARLESERRPRLDRYRAELRYLARGPEWAGQWIQFQFGDTLARWAVLEPLAHLYPQDRLRGSPLLFYGAVIDSLVRDANALAGIEHRVFGRAVGAGLRALNPGLARGELRFPDEEAHEPEFDPDGIYVLPETTAELHPVAGILTRGEGSSLSHIQLLARNLGIPNVVASEVVLPEIEERAGERIVMAVSPGGVVRLERDAPKWDAVFGKEHQAASGVTIVPDLAKLDLTAREMVPLDGLRASDSGRISGPKGANLGELKHRFGDRVPDGFVIPFGVFRGLLDRPLRPGGPAVFEWMKAQYAEIAAFQGPRDAKEKKIGAFLKTLRDWIESVDPGPEFRADLKRALGERFGADGSYGVFVRSDTNVEDLPGFTGAGLNLTVPYVVGSDKILHAVRRVWASPFTERAYAWRQAHMEQPEFVFPAVLLQVGFPSEKSGVMVTADIETGSRDWLTVAVNEGVGGAVDGQAAESLRVAADGGEVRFLAQATAPIQRELRKTGGVAKRPSTGTDTVLTAAEARKLAAFARTIPDVFPLPPGEDGQPVPADVEFGFRGGELALLQIRPFVESKGARSSRTLRELDAELARRGSKPVDLDGLPKE